MAHTLFTSRVGGVSSPPFDSLNLAVHVGDDPNSVLKNRAILAELIGLDISRIYFMNQVHGREVAIIDENSDPTFAPSVDALFTTLSGRALTTLIADCTPLLLKSKGAVAAVHVGRKGLVAEVLEATLDVFQRHGISNSEITAEIGPSICRDCYEVDIDTYREVVSKNPATATDEIRHCLDVTGGLQNRLLRYGISFEVSPLCVAHDPGFFSYRRDDVTGRQAGVIWL